jgi:putative endonuclease
VAKTDKIRKDAKLNCWNIYILKCSDNSLYTGITTDPGRRLREHNAGNRSAAKYTRARRPVCMVYVEPAVNRSEALRREYQIKQLSSEQKLELIRRSGLPNPPLD